MTTESPLRLTSAERRRLVGQAVSRQVGMWQTALVDPHHPENAAVRATLARLRRIPADDPSRPETWGITLPVVPVELAGGNDALSRAELAVHAALVLFAHHAQSSRERRHQSRWSLGGAVRQLVEQDGGGDGAQRRFVSAATATTWTQRMHHLRSLIALFRSKDIPLDYGGLAADLYQLQHPGEVERVRLKWGRDRYGSPPRQDPAIDPTQPTSQPDEEN